MSEYTHSLNLGEARAKIEGQIARRVAGSALSARVLEVLKGFDGKLINKRIVTALTKLDGVSAYLEDRPKWGGVTRFLYVWGCGVDYSERLTLAIRSENMDYAAFTAEGGAGYAHLHQADRVEEMQAVLADLPALVKAFNSALENYRGAIAAFAPCNPF